MNALRPCPALCALLVSVALAQGDRTLPAPNPELGPDDVVRIQITALQANDDPYPDAGIAVTFGFASPGNRQSTGPLERFALMVKGPAYGDMLYHVRAEYGELEIVGDRARLPVVLTTGDGQRIGYMFVLSKQQGGEYAGSWMTDGVFRFEVRQQDEI